MVKNGAMKTSAVGLAIVVLVGLIIVFVPVSSEKIEVQCITTPCPPIIESKTIYDILTTMNEPEPPEPVACIALFAPVCGVNGETFSNSCHAEVEGVEIAHEGECISEPSSAFCKIYPTTSGC